MSDYRGIYPAFYACYDDDGNISKERIKQYVRYLINAGVHGLYVGGSSGECIYQDIAERQQVVEAVMEEKAGSDIKIIAHVACNNTKDSIKLASHAQSQGVDAIAAIPPIYFRLPAHAIAKYWNDISSGAPDTDFFIYNIPQLAGVELTPALLGEMKKNKNVVGVKNSSMPTMDISLWRAQGLSIFNGPDEQLLSGLAAGAIGGIGGTFGVMPELYLALYNKFCKADIAGAIALQDELLRIIGILAGSTSSLYAVAKEVLRLRNNIDIGDVRRPLPTLDESGKAMAVKALQAINEAQNLI